MPIFALLADPKNYTPCSTENMLEDKEYREHWLEHFEVHFDVIAKLALEHYGPEAKERIEACIKDQAATLHAIKAKPDMLGGRLDLITLDLMRQEKLNRHRLPDPFEGMKARENTTMLALYPKVVAELDAHTSPREALLLATEGVFAGNIFDLGAGATAKMFASESPDFLKIRDDVGRKRPWLVDHFDAMADRILKGPLHRQAIFFCDNAGSDFVLGVLPFCRLLAKRGTRVLIAANDTPALNDMTYKELVAFLPRAQAVDPVLDQLVKADKIAPINSGGTAPLIDLGTVSDDINRAAPATDLVILEGMGRALESNYEATFTVDAIKLCMIKEEIIAKRHGGKNFDTVCRFDPAQGS
jgi:type II pantothenate kinase